MRDIAIIGTTASGKSNLAINIAKNLNGIILSLDSLSIYKEINIASAKPSKDEMQDIQHFGIDEIFVNDSFNVALFFELYKKAKKIANEKKSPLIIVGGTSFYLKAMLSGLSEKPSVSYENSIKVELALQNLENAYDFLVETDFNYVNKIEKNDKYRMQKWFEIYYQTSEIPSSFLKRTMKKPLIDNIDIFEIQTDKDILKQRINGRTKKMILDGLVDEVAYLEKKYTREPNCMKAIGIKEVLDYFDGIYNLEQMSEKIIINTNKLAKRQRTFNKTQFLQNIIKKPLHELAEIILNHTK